MANENKSLLFLTRDDFLEFCKVAVLEAAHDAVAAGPTSSGEATFALLATTDEKHLQKYVESLSKGLMGNAAVQVEAAGSLDASAIAYSVFNTAAAVLLKEVWGPDAERNQRKIPGTP